MLDNTSTINANNHWSIYRFRSIQIMLAVYRIIAAKYVLLNHLITGGTYMISMLYVFVAVATYPGNLDDLPWLILVFSVWILCSQTMLIMTAYHYFGEVYGLSSENLARLKKSKKAREIQRFLASCPPLRVYFGGFNFFDSTTSLVFQQFLVDRTVDLLLIQ